MTDPMFDLEPLTKHDSDPVPVMVRPTNRPRRQAHEADLFGGDRRVTIYAGDFQTTADYGDGQWAWQCAHCGTMLVSQTKPQQGNDVGSHLRSCEPWLAEMQAASDSGAAQVVEGFSWSEMPISVGVGS